MKLKPLFLGLGLILLLGCVSVPLNPKVSSDGVIDEAGIRKVMSDNGISGFSELVFDYEYALPTIDWIKNILSPTLQKEINSKNIQYEINSYDCEDYSELVHSIACYLNNQSKNKGIRGIALGQFYYQEDSGENHAINFAIVKKNDKELSIIFFEPQTGLIISLSKKEMESCFVWTI